MLAEGTVPTPSDTDEFTTYMKSNSRNGADVGEDGQHQSRVAAATQAGTQD